MPGTVSGPFGDPARGDSEQWIRDTLTQVVEDLSALTAAVAELAAQRAEERRAAAPGPATHRAKPRQRRDGGPALWIVRAVGVALLGLGLILAAMSPVRQQHQRYSPRCIIQCSQPVAHHAPAGRSPGR